MPTSRLAVAREPALGLVVRIFVGSVAERWDVPEPAREDLRLAASDLFAGAIEVGEGGDLVTFELSSDGREIELRAEDVTPSTEEVTDFEVSMGRFDLVRALFPDAEIGETVRIRVPSPA